MPELPSKIEDYALIGDCLTAALVGRNGSIDWLCWPCFDSDACFAALLGTADNGRWLIAPAEPARVVRRYRPHTLILETRFETASGTAVLIDFMPPRGAASDLIRIVLCERGVIRMRTELVLRFGYGAFVPWVTRVAEHTWHAVAGPDRVTLSASTPLQCQDLQTVGTFDLKSGERQHFVMTYTPSHLAPPEQPDPELALRDTEAFWREWAQRARLPERWSDAVIRSLITLRALVYRTPGGLVAAPTTSLPESLGGTR